jgi:hypothetical protein
MSKLITNIFSYDELPNELRLNILQFVCAKHLHQMRFVNRRLKSIIDANICRGQLQRQSYSSLLVTLTEPEAVLITFAQVPIGKLTAYQINCVQIRKD